MILSLLSSFLEGTDLVVQLISLQYISAAIPLGLEISNFTSCVFSNLDEDVFFIPSVNVTAEIDSSTSFAGYLVNVERPSIVDISSGALLKLQRANVGGKVH